MSDEFVPYLGEGGARMDIPDHRDLLYRDALGVGEPPELDWNAGYDNFRALEIDPITQDQDGSLSCTAQAVKSHVRKHLTAAGFGDDEISATPIYNAVRLSGGGAYIRDAIAFPASIGSLKESIAPSYQNGQPPTEDHFLNFVFTDELRELAKKLELFSYRMIPGSISSIDIFAHAIRYNHGGVGGYTGTNEGWMRPCVRPPQAGEHRWGHAVSHDAFGLMDVPDYGIPVGTKCIFTKNSWGDRYAIQRGRWKGYQAIPESYFSAGEQTAAGFVNGIYVFNAWVLVPDENINENQKLMDFLKVNDDKLLMDSGAGRSGAIGWVKGGKLKVASKDRVAQMLANYLVEKEGLGVVPEIWDGLKDGGLIENF